MTRPGLLAALVLLSGCAAEGGPRPLSPAVEAARAELVTFVRDGWHLPLATRVEVAPGAAGPAADGLVEAQLEEVRVAIARGAFDVLAVAVRVEERGEADVSYDPAAAGLTVALPADARAPVTAAELLAEVAAGFEWDELGPWWRGERTDELDRALARDLGKLDRLEAELGVQCRRLALLAGTVEARAEARDEPPRLGAAEAAQAREAQARATFALQRCLNTLARWRTAGEAGAFPRPDAVRLVLLRARLVLDGHLGWLLDIIVGRRPLLAVWRSDWWRRSPLFEVLDASAEVTVRLDGAPAALADPTASDRCLKIPAGAVRALLRLRTDIGLRSWFQELDERAAGLSSRPFQGTPLQGPAEAALRRVGPARALLARHPGSGFHAWKELWDARLKEGATLPLYGLVAGVATFLGDTRLVAPDPALRGAQLEAFAAKLRPGDVLLVRQEHFLSNAFLPGFWPHALLWLGPPEAWGALSDGALAKDAQVRAALGGAAADDHGPARVLEATSDGVVLSSLDHALAKDFVVVLRPRVAESEVAAALLRAAPHLGRPYDFDFDFGTDDRLVCTELVWRAWDPVLRFGLQMDVTPPPSPPIPGLVRVLGRLTMPAQEVARFAVHMADHPAKDAATGWPGKLLDVVTFVEPDGRGGAVVREGPEALKALRATLDR